MNRIGIVILGLSKIRQPDESKFWSDDFKIITQQRFKLLQVFLLLGPYRTENSKNAKLTFTKNRIIAQMLETLTITNYKC